MSGRSAVVRKKNATPLDRKGSTSHPRPASSTPSDHSDRLTISDFPLPPGPVGTGIGTTNARFLKFSPHGPQNVDPRGWAIPGGGDPRRDGYGQGQGQGMPENWGHGRSRRPTIKTEDVSGIEKSGLRSMLDKRSDAVRKGMAKTFAFRKKDKDDRRGSVDRPESAATVRQNPYLQEEAYGYDDYVPLPASQPSMSYPGYHPHQLPSPTSPQNMPSWEINPIGPPPTSKLPPIPQTQTSTPMMKRWVGAGRPVSRWSKLRKDPELWDPNGDVLVYLGRKGQSPRQPPSFRLSSHIIESTESRYLITLLREGSNEEDIYMPPSPAGAPPMVHRGHGAGQLTPPTSEDASQNDDFDGQISYEMYFPPPSNLNRNDQLRHQITTRNVFALLCHASIVGLSLYQALTDLHTRLDSYMPPENDNVGHIVNYIFARGIDDVRADPETAISLLAWAEGSEVRWEEGWRECFIHCAGMYGPELERCADFKYTTPIARALLERASLETQLRVQAAEERLGEFLYSDMWPENGPISNGPARAAAERLHQMLLGHYSRAYGCWPPTTPSHQSFQPGSPDSEQSVGEEIWLTRRIVMDLQRDFGALYDYLVDRDIVWDVSEARSGRKWMMASVSGNMAFEADLPELPMTDMFIEYDNKLRFPHIPHAYPLIPESIPPSTSATGGIFKSNRKPDPKANRAGATERRVQLAYTESTNIYSLGSDFVPSDLVDAFVKFEKGDRVGEVDPAVARRGRWVLIYGILQTLASISVDDPNVRYHDKVPYHLSPRLRGTRIPPWRSAGTPGNSMGEASHELSHCWIAPQAWGSNRPDSGLDLLGGTSPVIGGPMGPGPGPGRSPGLSPGWSSGGGVDTPGSGARSVTSFASGER
ncbi:Fc.00g054320.m01.CDS01 [Cosmosporella sp. VM-42]